MLFGLPSGASGHPGLQQRQWGKLFRERLGTGQLSAAFHHCSPRIHKGWAMDTGGYICFIFFFPHLVSVCGPVLLNVSKHFFESPEIIYLQNLEYLSSINSSPEWWVVSPSHFSSLPSSHWLYCSCDHEVSCFNSLKQQKANLCFRKNIHHPQVLQIQQK